MILIFDELLGGLLLMSDFSFFFGYRGKEMRNFWIDIHSFRLILSDLNTDLKWGTGKLVVFLIINPHFRLYCDSKLLFLWKILGKIMSLNLDTLIRRTEIEELKGSLECPVEAVVFDSRRVEPGALFVAVRGSAADGHDYIGKAVEAGAGAVVCEEFPPVLQKEVTYVRVKDSSLVLGDIASRFYGEPSKKLKLVGVTGTNGKTTTATLLYDLFRKLGHKAGLISTVCYRIEDEEMPSTHTTPDAVTLNGMLREMADKGCEYCFMEVSSHSVVQHRIEGLTFAGGLFTNITHDHLDYHGSFAAYIKAKKGFFDALPKGAFALYNGDDRNGEVMMQNTEASVKSFALKRMADYKCKIIESLFGGMLLQIDGTELWVRFIGEFNAYNLLGVYAAAMELGQDKETVLREMSLLHSVAGRFDYMVSKDGVTAIVDYAHTPDALKNVLNTVNAIRNGNQKLYTVVGCGGNRDKAKRPVMARIAVEKSDFVILTSDNPRFEKPEDILNDMEEGLKECPFAVDNKFVVIPDRAAAIKMAVLLAKGVPGGAASGKHGDIILIAGKGHETYQEIEGVRHHFDDKEQVALYFDK